MTDANKTDDNEASAELRDGIEQTRAGMSATINALETKLSPQEVRGKVETELGHLETKVREVVREHLAEAKDLVKEELAEAKGLLRDEMNEAETKIKKGLTEARDTVKKDLQEAMTDAKRSVRAATIGRVENLATDIGDAMNDTRDTLIDTIRNNPLPAALTGLGVAWLLMNRSSSAASRRSSHGSPGAYGYGGRDTGARWPQDAHAPGADVGSVIGGAVHRVSDTASSLAHGASDAAGSALHQASDAAGSALHGTADLIGRAATGAGNAGSALLHSAGDASAQLAHRASDAAVYVGEHARTGGRRIEVGLKNTLHESPLALAAAALAAGAAVGFSLPRTHGEDAWMGDARDQVMRKAGAAAHDAAAAIGGLTEKAGESAKRGLSEATASNGR